MHKGTETSWVRRLLGAMWVSRVSRRIDGDGEHRVTSAVTTRAGRQLVTDFPLKAGIRGCKCFQRQMLYDPECDLYALLAVSADASEDQIRDRIDGLRGVKDDGDLDEVALVLLDLESRTRYDTRRATHRMRIIMRDGLSVFTGRTPALGVPRGWPPEGH
jgi:hypothetical protein